MKFKSAGIAILLMTTFIFSGCTSKPIYNFQDEPITTSSGTPSDSQVVKAIIRAGSSLGWTMKKEAPGHIVGTLNIRKHIAIVDITYDSGSYSIIYKDSTNLNYNGE